ncbi:MAG: cytidylyltransferase domain-containing protein [Candidatus Hydrogenedentota bacterium]
MSRVAFIPARGGSKGIPHKNIRPFCGRPLIYWVARAAQDCSAIDAVYLATEDAAIADTARALGLSKLRVIERDPATATDEASTESALLDFAGRVDFGHAALLQGTSPLLTADDLDRGWELMASGAYDSVLSVVRQKRFRWRVEENGAAQPENYAVQARPRRQQFDGYLVENGAFYITSRARLEADQCRIGGRIGVAEMPEDTYYELDDATDWTIMEALLTRRLRRVHGPLADRMRNLIFVASDIDGCLTDSGMYYAEGGDELKKFNTRDGKGFGLLRESGLVTGIITQEDRALNTRRARKLHIDELRQGAKDKVAVMEELLEHLGLDWAQVAFFGDDLGDVELLRRVGVSACPVDAIPEVRAVADFVIDVPGGHGAFRAFAERILEAKSK